jgi:hypothetical protein
MLKNVKIICYITVLTRHIPFQEVLARIEGYKNTIGKFFLQINEIKNNFKGGLSEFFLLPICFVPPYWHWASCSYMYDASFPSI